MLGVPGSARSPSGAQTVPERRAGQRAHNVCVEAVLHRAAGVRGHAEQLMWCVIVNAWGGLTLYSASCLSKRQQISREKMFQARAGWHCFNPKNACRLALHRTPGARSQIAETMLEHERQG